MQGEHRLWKADCPVPAVEALERPRGTVDVVVHRADERYRFLHDNALVWHDGTLFASWYNCPRHEMVEASCIRARRSRDGGGTWSEPEVVAADGTGKGVLYVPAVFLSHRGTLHAFVSNMTGPDLVTECEGYVLDRALNRWRSVGFVAGPFLPNSAPVRMQNGDFIMAGRTAPRAGCKPETPAVAVSKGDDVTSAWRVIPLAAHGDGMPYGRFPETALWVRGPELTAVVRGGTVFLSHDYGRTWRGPLRHNLAAEDSKLYAVTLSTGQRYLVWNRPDPEGPGRNLLVLAVSRPGESGLAAMWRLRRGYEPALTAGPEWSYPCACEHNGKLYIIYTSEKKHSVMSIVPVESLAVLCCPPIASK